MYVCSGNTAAWSSMHPMQLCMAHRGWVVPFQKPQGRLGVGTRLSGSYFLRQCRDQPPPPSAVRPQSFVLLGDKDGASRSALWCDSRADPLAPYRATHLLPLWTVAARAALGSRISPAPL